MSALKNELKRLKKLSPEASSIANQVLRECRQREQKVDAEIASCQKELKAIKAEQTKSETAIRQEAVKPFQQELHRLKDELEKSELRRVVAERNLYRVFSRIRPDTTELYQLFNAGEDKFIKWKFRAYPEAPLLFRSHSDSTRFLGRTIPEPMRDEWEIVPTPTDRQFPLGYYICVGDNGDGTGNYVYIHRKADRN